MSAYLYKSGSLRWVSQHLLAILLCLLLTGCDFFISSGNHDDDDKEEVPPQSEATVVTASAAAALPTLRTLTYNINHGKGTDGVLDLERIAAVIASQMPDLVALQEVDDETLRSLGVDQAAAIATAAGMPYFVFGRAIDYSGGEYGVAILSKYPLLLSGNEALPVSDGFEPRTALWAEVAVPGIGQVLFVATHLEAYFEFQDRVAQAIRLNELFATALLTPAGTAMPPHVIVAGDLNAATGSAAINILSSEFIDAYTGVKDPTFPSIVPTDAYDWVIIDKDSPLASLQSWVLDETLASDHRPVVVDFELSN